MAFVHLHNHSDRSILDGATRISDLVRRAVELEMPAVALTDHGYLFGIPDLDLECSTWNKSKDPARMQWEQDCDAARAGEQLKRIEAPVEPQAPQLNTGPDATPEEIDAATRAHNQYLKDHDSWLHEMRLWSRRIPPQFDRECELLAQGGIEALQNNAPDPLIKPIFGCEAYFITDDMIEKKSPQLRYHLILLAKNEQGYGNLMKMMSEAANEQFYYRPRTTLDMLKRYHEGLICLSACAQGIIPYHIRHDQPDVARQWACTYKDIFGDDFYIEIQNHGLEPTEWNGWTDRTLSEALISLARELDIKIVATNDVHYLTREDAPIQDIMSCIGTNSKLDETNRKHMEGTEFYMKSEAEMRSLFEWCPEACDNTVSIADKCDYSLDWSHLYLPKFPMLEEGETSEERFRKECETGLAWRYGENWRELEIAGVNVRERFEFEYKVICDKGFADYFLIVQEYVRWAKENGIGVGPGRGSAAGAIVAYAMDITTFDPLENGLLFERFLSMERSEMPDIDMDFDDERRLEVIQHVREIYGAECVCHVITYSTIKAKQAINDAARVLDFPPYVGQRLSKMISNSPGATLDATLERKRNKEDLFSPDFVQAYQSDDNSRRIIDAALSIEGLTRGEGVHACAVLITPTPVNDHVPTKVDTKGGVEITQYEGHTVADMGLLKMDFLGLRTLTVISKARANILKNHGVEIDIDAIPFDDPKIFELLCSGHTAGVFQVESGGMTATIKNMKPTEYKHVVAIIALYRPGPLGAGMVNDYIERMNGRQEVSFYDNRLSDILDETYGTMVYQEQVMQISMKMCGFSAGESDSRIRKPVAKKKIKLLTKEVFDWEDHAHETTYDHWMNGARTNGYSEAVAQKIWDDVLEFASYAFNKSHSAGYAILVMQTAWLKAHYPREFMAAVLTSYTGKTDKIVRYIAACRHEGIDVLPPDINESGSEFTAVPEGIRIGFAGIRGVGDGVAQTIIAERDAGGPFKNILDFLERVDSTQANRRVIEALIKSGAFDSTGYTRMQLMRLVDKNNPANIYDRALSKQRERAMGMQSFFDLFEDDEDDAFRDEMPEPDGIEWDRNNKLALELEVLGIYISDHPLSPYRYALSKSADCALSALSVDPSERSSQLVDGASIWVAGMVSKIAKRVTRDGNPMATLVLEDLEGEAELVAFPRVYEKNKKLLDGLGGDNPDDVNRFLRAHCKIDDSDRGLQLIVQELKPLDLNAANNQPKVIELLMKPGVLDRNLLEGLSAIFADYPGLDRVEFRIEEENGSIVCVELPVQVDANNLSLKATIMRYLGERGRLVVA